MAGLDDLEDCLRGGVDVAGVLHGEEDLLDVVGAGEVAGDGIGDQDGLVADFGLAEGVDALSEDADDGEGDAADGDGLADGAVGGAVEGFGEGVTRRRPWRGEVVLIVEEAAGEDFEIADVFVCGETPRSMVSLVTPLPMLMVSWNSSMGEAARCRGPARDGAHVFAGHVVGAGLSGPALLPPV